MKAKIEWVYKILILIVCSIGIYLNCKALQFGNAIVYYTIQSNILCFSVYLIIIIMHFLNKLEKNGFYYFIKGLATMSITLTMVVYQLVIRSSGVEMPGTAISNDLVHLVVPIMIMLDYVIFGEKGNLNKKFPLYWGISIIAYTLYCYILIGFGVQFSGTGKYPYPYMDPTTNGPLAVFISYISIYTLYTLYGELIVFLDKKFSKNKGGV